MRMYSRSREMRRVDDTRCHTFVPHFSGLQLLVPSTALGGTLLCFCFWLLAFGPKILPRGELSNAQASAFSWDGEQEHVDPDVGIAKCIRFYETQHVRLKYNLLDPKEQKEGNRSLKKN